MDKLFDIGERNIVQNIIYDIFPHLRNFHDDTINLPVNKYSILAFSTDPCPKPIICKFDPNNKYYYYGWMSVLINYSDLAAEGVEPIGILLSTIMPNDMEESDYREFLLGVKDACEAWGGNLLGGNIKDGATFSITGMAIGGKRENGNLLTRKGMEVGDAVCVVGEMGIFWLALMQLIDGYSLSEMDEIVRSYIITPYPKLRESELLSKSFMVTSCMDSSDGIIGCLYELATLNNVSIHIIDSKLVPNERLREYCEQKGVNYRNFMLAFGGWELVFSCKNKDIENLQNIFKENNLSFNVIGYADNCCGHNVLLECHGSVYKVNDFSSKRFDSTSMFSFGIDPIIEQLSKSQFELIK